MSAQRRAVEADEPSRGLKLVRIFLGLLAVGFIILLVVSIESKPKGPWAGSGDFHVPRPESLEDVEMSLVMAKMQHHPGLLQDEATHDRAMKGASDGQKAVFACLLYRGEVDSMGHYVFFRERSGMMWEDVLDGLELIGANRHRSVFEHALKSFPSDPPRDYYYRVQELNKLSVDAFDEADERFEKLVEEEQEDIEKLARAYIQEHPDEFFTAE